MDYCDCGDPWLRTSQSGNALVKREEAATTGKRPDFVQSCSFRAFFRLRLRANASFTRFFSPGFK
jgi:hypothetical protein